MEEMKDKVNQALFVGIILVVLWGILGTLLMQLAAIAGLMGGAGWLFVTIYRQGGVDNDTAQRTFIEMTKASNEALVTSIIAATRSNNLVAREIISQPTMLTMKEQEQDVEVTELA